MTDDFSLERLRRMDGKLDTLLVNTDDLKQDIREIKIRLQLMEHGYASFQSFFDRLIVLAGGHAVRLQAIETRLDALERDQP